MSSLNPLNWFRPRPAVPVDTLPGHEATHQQGVPWVRVQSSNLDRIAYYPSRKVLLVQFHHGGCYRYSGVPGGVWNALASAPSKGVYHAHYIKWVYPYEGPFSEDDPELIGE
jgi:hypothetical protein